MKKIHNMIWGVVAIVALCSSCMKIEDTYSTILDPKTMMTTELDFNMGLNGIYDDLNVQIYGRDQAYLFWGMSDVWIASQTYINPYANRQFNSTNTQYIWRNYYYVIRDALNLKKDALECQNLSEEARTRIAAECDFMKGFAYFGLVRLWGGVPIIDEILDANSNFDRPRASVDDVYDLIFKSFELAYKNLPTPSEMVSIGNTLKDPTTAYHTNKHAAFCAMANSQLTYACYLNSRNRTGEALEHFKLAVNFADSVIMNYPAGSLYKDYAGIYDINKRLASSTEVLYRATFIGDDNGRGCLYPSFYIPKRAPEMTGNYGSTVRIQPWFVDQFYADDTYCNPNDPTQRDQRLDVNFYTQFTNANGTTYFTYPNPGGKDEKGSLLSADLNVITGTFSPPFTSPGMYRTIKFAGTINNWNRISGDIPIITVAEAYLIKAEALNEMGADINAILEPLNVLRARARSAASTANPPRSSAYPKDETPDSFAAFRERIGEHDAQFAMRLLILRERDLELLGQNLRYFDLRRMLYKDGRTMFEYMFTEYFLNLPLSKRQPLSFSQQADGTVVWGPGRLFLKGVNLTEDGTALDISAAEFKKYLLLPIPEYEIINNSQIGYEDDNPGWN